MGDADNAGPTAPSNRVLVVDDDRDIRDALTLALEATGCEVRAVPDGRDALGVLILGEWIPDVVVLDLMMPQVNGQTVLRALQRMPRFEKVRVVVLTASNDLSDPALQRAGAVLRKPADVEELLAQVACAA